MVDPDFEKEQQAVKEVGWKSSLISFEELSSGNISSSVRYVQPADLMIPGLYRGWMMTPEQYQQLYEVLLQKNIRLINSPEEYRHCHYLPASYEKIKDITPLTRWLPIDPPVDWEAVLAAVEVFGDGPIIVKDFVKSEKHHWEEACFIPRASDQQKLQSVVNSFLELRGEGLNEGLVFRQYEELEFLTMHSQSGMPLTMEFRIFFVNRQVSQVCQYWGEGAYGDSRPALTPFIERAQNIQSNFFTMDIAKKKNGEWIIMELGDGQVAGLPSQTDCLQFYQSLKTCLTE